MKKGLLAVFLIFSALGFSQSNIRVSTIAATDVLGGNYQASDYAAAVPISNPDQIVCELNNLVSPDSLLQYLRVLESFETRHTLSDTISDSVGIGAARRWIYQKMRQYASRNGQRLLPAYLTFDYANTGCGEAFDLKSVMGILPGSDPQAPLVIIEGHMDSRCEGRCDSTCYAAGVDDNASGTALVMELARVMSAYSFSSTIVFTTTTGEEQGLLGAEAFADYLDSRGIAVKAVLNNDVIGGIVCGETASPPGCAPPYAVDSTHTRLYANTQNTSNPSQALSRSIKIFYDEKIKSQVRVPMELVLIDQQDRLGRGGDHIPFSNLGVAASRFSSAHEHGNANTSDSSYSDHQHTSDDVLGADTTGDGQLDTFFVNVNYLARNAVINGVAAAQLAAGPAVPEFDLNVTSGGLEVEILNPAQSFYRVGVLGIGETDFEAIYRFPAGKFLVPGLQSGKLYFLSVAALDSNRVMSPFGLSQARVANVTTAPAAEDSLNLVADCQTFSQTELIYTRSASRIEKINPNPARNKVTINYVLGGNMPSQLEIMDIQGRMLKRINLGQERGTQQIDMDLQLKAGSYLLLLRQKGQVVDSQKLLIQ